MSASSTVDKFGTTNLCAMLLHDQIYRGLKFRERLSQLCVVFVEVGSPLVAEPKTFGLVILVSRLTRENAVGPSARCLVQLVETLLALGCLEGGRKWGDAEGE